MRRRLPAHAGFDGIVLADPAQECLGTCIHEPTTGGDKAGMKDEVGAVRWGAAPN